MVSPSQNEEPALSSTFLKIGQQSHSFCPLGDSIPSALERTRPGGPRRGYSADSGHASLRLLTNQVKKGDGKSSGWNSGQPPLPPGLWVGEERGLNG